MLITAQSLISMSHIYNSILYDELMDQIPLPRLKELQAQGFSEIEILNKFRTGDLQKLDAIATLANDEYNDENPIGGTVDRYDMARENELTQ